MISRRRLLQAAGAGALLSGCERSLDALAPWRPNAAATVPLSVLRPGMHEGHWLRDLAARAATLPVTGRDERTEVAIVGAGIAGLSAGWTLARHSRCDFVLLLGPEATGNAAAGQWRDVPFPRGAHYLPLPASECAHVRELLDEIGVRKVGSGDTTIYDERALVHAPEERLLKDGVWHEHLLPDAGLDADALAQQRRFFAQMEALKQARGRDGKRIFALPLALASRDLGAASDASADWRALDAQTFAQWLQRAGYTAPALRWYLDYAMRDDYGADSQQVSAFAGLHYFACRDATPAKADGGAVLTWPDGLQPLARHLLGASRAQLRPGMAVRVRPGRKEVELLYTETPGGPLHRLRARRLILATPLHVARHLLPPGYLPGLAPEALPAQASWLIGNVALSRFPRELSGAGLAWDNVVYGSNAQGYVVATHQWLRAARPEFTVFTSYRTLPFAPGHATRRWLAEAGDEELRTLALQDLQAAYGSELLRHCAQIELTLRGHAMAVPTPGYLARRQTGGLDQDGPVLFAHSDLSGYSVFEEASYWGVRAAQRCL